MALTTFTPSTLIKSSEVNTNFNVDLSVNIRNHLRQLLDRVGVYSKDGTDVWGEAYTSATGRNGSVLLAETTAQFNTNKYGVNTLNENTSDTTHDPDSFSNVANAFDDDPVTAATKDTPGSAGDYTFFLGKTFSSKLIKFVTVDASVGIWRSSGVSTIGIYLQTYDGSTWTDVMTLVEAVVGPSDGRTFNGTVLLNQTTQGVRLRLRNHDNVANFVTCSVRTFHYGNTLRERIITHTIPAGTTLATIQSAIGEALIEDWEEGANIQYKLTNTTEDTGWLTRAEIEDYTAFTGQATKLIVKLIPAPSPTSINPSIRAAGFIAR
jgi:hypothetical protein